MTESGGAAVSRSGFVSGLAWTFIVLAGFTTAIAILQNMMLALISPGEELRASMETVENAPALLQFLPENLQLFFFAFLVFSAATLVSAIGLLKRQNWARLVFIGFMALGVISNLASLAMPFVMPSLLPEIPGQTQPDFHDDFELLWTITIGVTIVVGLVFAALFAWVIKRLMAEDVRREFLAR